jgi:hypothetical protein
MVTVPLGKKLVGTQQVYVAIVKGNEFVYDHEMQTFVEKENSDDEKGQVSLKNDSESDTDESS